MYGPFINEELVGKAIRGKRDQVVLATKFGNMRGNDGAFLGVNGRPDYVRDCCDASLKRLGVDHIDLYYQHRIDQDRPHRGDGGRHGRAGAGGQGPLHRPVRGRPRDDPPRPCRVHPLAALQTEYSLWSRDPEDEILPTVRELGIGFVAYSPLGRGFLTGRFRRFEDIPEGDYRRNSPRFQGENFDQNLALVDRINAIAEQKGVKPSQLALAWVLAQGRDIVPIPGTTRREHLQENIAALDIVLGADDLQRIDAVAPLGVAAGPRYPEWAMQHVNG